MRLTPRQKAILARMCRRDMMRDGPESGGEMAKAMWGTGAFTSYEQGQRAAKQLVAKGLAYEIGRSETYAQCYGPTDTGRRLWAEIEADQGRGAT